MTSSSQLLWFWYQSVSTFCAPTYYDVIQSVTGALGVAQWVSQLAWCEEHSLPDFSDCHHVVMMLFDPILLVLLLFENSLRLVQLFVAHPTEESATFPSWYGLVLKFCVLDRQTDLSVASLGNQPGSGAKRAEPGKQHKQHWNSVQTTSKDLPTNGFSQWCQPITFLLAGFPHPTPPHPKVFLLICIGALAFWIWSQEKIYIFVCSFSHHLTFRDEATSHFPPEEVFFPPFSPTMHLVMSVSGMRPSLCSSLCKLPTTRWTPSMWEEIGQDMWFLFLTFCEHLHVLRFCLCFNNK